jgi:hypothetical protein
MFYVRQTSEGFTDLDNEHDPEIADSKTFFVLVTCNSCNLSKHCISQYRILRDLDGFFLNNQRSTSDRYANLKLLVDDAAKVLGIDSLGAPAMDPLEVLTFQVGGAKFTSIAQHFFQDKKTLIGSCYANGTRNFMYDKDPRVFESILNWYRYGDRTRLFKPRNVPLEIMKEDMLYFNIVSEIVDCN